MMSRTAGAALAIFAVLAATGCDYLPFGYTPIKDITTAPAQFEGREVKIRGRVQTIVKVLGVQAFSLQDETGASIIVATDGPLPAENAEVALKGVVRSAVIIGGASLGLKVDETKRLP